MNHDSTVTDDRRNHDLYRMRDLSGRLLYIGVTNGGLRRFMEHSKDKTWWREVDTINVEHVHCSRQAIEMLEREAIKSESPLYNVAHNNEPLPATTRRRENARALSYADQIMAAAERQALNALTPPLVAPVLSEQPSPVDLMFDELNGEMQWWVRHQLWEPQTPSQEPKAIAEMAARRALLVGIATHRPQTNWADDQLIHAIAGGWGVPIGGDLRVAMGKLSASDAVTMVGTYLPQEIGERLNIGWAALVA